jgi:septal ring factor EnvC (AmiA/AmiB activator)
MSRNCYTRTIRTSEHQQHHRQEKELAIIARELQRMGTEPTPTPTDNDVKQRRRVRLAHNR